MDVCVIILSAVCASDTTSSSSHESSSSAVMSIPVLVSACVAVTSFIVVIVMMKKNGKELHILIGSGISSVFQIVIPILCLVFLDIKYFALSLVRAMLATIGGGISFAVVANAISLLQSSSNCTKVSQSSTTGVATPTPNMSTATPGQASVHDQGQEKESSQPLLHPDSDTIVHGVTPTHEVPPYEI